MLARAVCMHAWFACVADGAVDQALKVVYSSSFISCLPINIRMSSSTLATVRRLYTCLSSLACIHTGLRRTHAATRGKKIFLVITSNDERIII